MVCYHPIEAWIHTHSKTENGKDKLVFSYHPKTCAQTTPDLQVPCGRCIGCRLAKAREWSVRCMHEASLYWENCWLTLTMNDDYLYSRENPYSLERGNNSEITRFLKRLRKKYGSGIRYFYCAEYGETCFFCNKSETDCHSKGCGEYHAWRGRPHYHVCIFNHDFNDKTLYKMINGKPHYNSEELDSLWTDPKTGVNMGYATISELNEDTAGYTARYSLKKITGALAEEEDPDTGLRYYERLTEDGQIISLEPEYVNMSRGSKKLGTGGIGKGWLDKYSKEVLDNDSVLYKELRIQPPKYYDKIHERIAPLDLEENKLLRVDKAENDVNNTEERLSTREYITLQKTEKLYRKEI